MKAVLLKNENRIESLNQNAFENLVDQAIHDIQSPLEAMKYLLEELSLGEKDHSLLIQSLKRITDIVSTVKKREFQSKKENKQSVNIFSELLLLAREREIAYQHKVKVQFINTINDKFGICLDELSLKRSFVNLLNNAIEASREGANVLVSLSQLDQNFIISVKDTGMGMNPEMLNKVGSKGATFNKVNGSGIGLFQVFNFVNSNNGFIEIISKENLGTEVVMSFPVLATQGNRPFEYVLIDNDELIRFIWEKKAKDKGISLLSLSDPEQLYFYVDRISKTETQIYIDSELDNCVRGEFVAKKLFEKGYKNLFMTTGYAASRFSHYKFLQSVGKAPAF